MSQAQYPEQQPGLPPVQTPQELIENPPSFWTRYTSHGELPWSSASSLGLHLLLVLIMVFLAGKLAQSNPAQPAVDTITVLPDESSAAGESADEAEEMLESTEQNQQTSEPPVTPQEQIQEVVQATPKGFTVDPTKTATTDQQIASQTQNFKERLKDSLAKTVTNNASSKSTGGGGGSSAKGRGARLARWVMRFNTRNAQDYMAQLDGLGAAVAFPTANDRYRYFTNLVGSPTSTIKDLSSETRLFWVDERPESYQSVARALGVNDAPFMVAFMPAELEKRMLELELSYGNLAEEDIASTQFEVVRRGSDYDVIVVRQVPR